MDSMADLMRKLGWIAWCLMVIGWFLSPIITVLVDKMFAYLEFDASTKLKDLEIHTIPTLKQMLGAMEEKMVLGAAQNKASLFDLKILDTIKKDLKSALYEAEDILDLVDYHRIEKGLYLGDDGSRRWVEYKLGAACVWIARCKRSWFGRWIDVTLAVIMKSMTWLWQFVIQGCLLVNMAGAAVLQCTQSWYQHLGQLLRRVIHHRSGGLLPVSAPSFKSRGSVIVPVDPTHWPAEEMVVEEEIVEETQVLDGEVEIEEELEEIENGEGGEIAEKIEESCGEVGDTAVGEIEDDKKGKEGGRTSLSILQYCARSMLTCYVKACFYRNWSYGIVGIKSDKVDSSAAELVPITERISLRKRIERIENILTDSNKSYLLNDKNSSSGTSQNADQESSSFKVKNSAKKSSSKQKEIDKLFINIDQKVFGREEDRAHICRILREGPHTYGSGSNNSKPYSVIGIYGITGSGKSTLAQYVCDYEKGVGHFNPIMFITVGKTFSMGDIFRDMLYQIKQQQAADTKDSKGLKAEVKDLESLKAELMANLKGKCFLLVLDDLWVNDDNQKERDILLDTLTVALSGSIILVTAQKKDAAEALGAQEQIPIPDLEEKVYLSLFMHHARPNAANDCGEYEKIGRKIANRLCSSPIAAVTVGKQLQRNKSISFWETTANLDVLDKTMGALWWSYQQLGIDIRRCFAYCRIFPKGYEINRDELVRLWIAQGFVNTRNNTTEELEDIGQSYFSQLLTLSFLQVRKQVFRKQNVAFTIHDLLHELAVRVSGSEFFSIGLNGSPVDIPRGVNHLFIETKTVAEINEKNLNQGLRTLIINEDSYEEYPEKSMKTNHDLENFLRRLFMRLTKLRVLVIKLNFYAEELSVPACVDQMKHLRYLGFHSGDGLLDLILPSTFSKLYHMQTIDIPSVEASCPQDMANLIYLRHISAPLSFPYIGRLTALQTLEKFIVKEEPGHELKQLMHINSLRGSLIIWRLGIVGSKAEALEAHLTHKDRLRELKLDFSWDKRFGPDVEAEVLEGLCPPLDIQELHIKDYRGSRYPSWMLSRHRPDTPKQLHRLEICFCSQLASVPEGSELFIGLRELCIHGCDWNSLPENMERLVLLQTLEIQSCKKMEHLPTLPQALNTIEISGCDMLKSISIMDCSTGCPIIGCPNLVTLQILGCGNLARLPNLPPSLKNLSIRECGELCSVSGQLDQLEKLDIYKCNKLESVNSLGDASSLETLILCTCQCIASLGSSGGPGSYMALRRLHVQYCPAMDMKQFNKNVLDGLVHKQISRALSSKLDERA